MADTLFVVHSNATNQYDPNMDDIVLCGIFTTRAEANRQINKHKNKSNQFGMYYFEISEIKLNDWNAINLT